MTDPQLPPEVSNRLYDKIQEIAQDLRARGIAPQNGAAEATQNGAAPSNGSSNGAAADPQQLNGNTPTSVADLYDPRSYQPFESQLEHYWAQSRDGGGRYTHGPTPGLKRGPDSFHPDSKYWQIYANGARDDLGRILGAEDYRRLMDMIWPDGDHMDSFTWRTIAEMQGAALSVADKRPEDLEGMAAAARNRLLKLIEALPVAVELFDEAVA